MQSTIDTPNLGPVTISKHVVKYFSKSCSGDMEEALARVTEILKGAHIEQLEI